MAAQRANCPYCGEAGIRPPPVQGNCPRCGETIHVIRHADGRGELATTQRFDQFRRERLNARIPKLTEEVALAKEQQEWPAVAGLSRQLAQALHLDGQYEAAFEMLAQSRKYDLMRFKWLGVRWVTISTCDDDKVCQACKLLEGRRYTVVAAMEEMPIPTKHFDGGLCRCLYVVYRRTD